MMPALPGSRVSVFNLLDRAEGATSTPRISQRPTQAIVTVSYGPISFDNPASTPQQTAERNPLEILLVCWATGLLIMLARQGIIEWRSARMLRGMNAILDGRILDLVEKCRREMNLWRQIRVANSDRIRTPAICGFWRTTLILPANITMSDAELRLVVLHELAHARRFDLQMDRLLSFVRDVHWFNPIAWLMLSRWRAEREMACDEKVLRMVGMEHQQQYGQIILNLVERLSNLPRAAGAVGLFESASNLRRRIRVIGSFENSKRRWILGSIIVLCLIAAVLTDAKTTNATAPAPIEQTAMASNDDFQTRTYDISDMANRGLYLFTPRSRSPENDAKEFAERRKMANQYIIKAIHDALPAKSWKDSGGEGTIAGIPGKDQIVISQSPKAFEQIEKRLAELRHLTGIQINIQSYFLELSDSAWQKFGPDNNKPTEPLIYLSDQTAQTLLDKTKADTNCSITSAPRVTVFNGQQADVAIVHKEQYVGDISLESDGHYIAYSPKVSVVSAGPKLHVQAFVEPSEKTMNLRIRAQITKLLGLQEVKLTSQSNSPGFQRLVADVHELEANVMIFTGAIVMMRLHDTTEETPGRSYWILIRPQLVGTKQVHTPATQPMQAIPIK